MSEFVFHISIPETLFKCRDWTCASCAGEKIDVVCHVLRWEIEDAFLGSKHVLRCLGHGQYAEHAAMGEPPGGGHRADIVSRVFVFRSYENHRCAPEQDCWRDNAVHDEESRKVENYGKSDLDKAEISIRQCEHLGNGFEVANTRGLLSRYFYILRRSFEYHENRDSCRN